MNLLEILQCFKTPIKEEQAWAICYQCAICLKLEAENNSYKLLCGPESIQLHEGGYVTIFSDSSASETEVIKMLGLALFAALDHNVMVEEEQVLSKEMDNLISIMTSHLTAETYICSCALHDQTCLEYIILLCEQHLPNRLSPNVHYQSVCAGLIFEAQELGHFLTKIAMADKSLFKLTTDDALCTCDRNDDDITKLNFVEWAHTWMQVLEQLRHGVTKLQKVKTTERPKTFNLIPFEALMEDIRNRKSRLKKVPANPLQPVVKKTAHDVILDVIRSRPNLSPAHKRVLAPTPPQSKSLHDRLIEQIRGHSVPLKHVEQMVTCSSTSECLPKSSLRRRLPKPELDDMADDDHVPSNSDMETQELNIVNDDNIQARDVSLHMDVSDLSSSHMSKFSHPPISDRLSNSMRRKHLLPLELPPSPGDKLNKPPSSTDISKLSSFCEPSDFHRSKSIAFQSSMYAKRTNTPPSSLQRSASERRTMGRQKPNEYLTLTLDEVMHIRQVMSRDQLERFQSSSDLYSALKDEQVCFRCHIKKFGIFVWPYTCHMCKRKVCGKCVKKTILAPDHLISAPLHTIVPSTRDHYHKGVLSGVQSKIVTAEVWPHKRKVEVCLDCHLLVGGMTEMPK